MCPFYERAKEFLYARESLILRSDTVIFKKVDIMEWLYAVIKGILQGATEFIPISSSAHLVLFRSLAEAFGMTQPNPFIDEFFDIMLHIGTLLAVVVFFRSEIGRYLRSLISQRKTFHDDTGQHWHTNALTIGIVVSFLITSFFAIAGLKGSEVIFAGLQDVPLFQGIPDLTQFYIAHPKFVAINLLMTGLFLAFAEWKAKGHSGNGVLHEGEENSLLLRPVSAVGIGIAQACAALFRGISRSGSTMAAGLILGLTRQQAARFSFWLSIPIFVAASGYEVLKLIGHDIPLGSLPWGVMLIGTAVSFIVGYACIAFLLKLLAKFPLTIFSYYCWVVGLVMFFFIL